MLNSQIETKRTLLFLLLCIPLRVYFVYFAKYHQEYVEYTSPIALIIAIGFFYIYMFNLRKTGTETFGQPIWWNSLRPFHSLMYFTFAYFAIYHKDKAWIPLAIDVIIGFSFYIFYKADMINFIS